MKTNRLEKVAGGSGVEDTGKNYGVTESYARRGIKNFILAGSAIILGLTYGCGGLRFHPEEFHPAEEGWRRAATTGELAGKKLTKNGQYGADVIARTMSRGRDNNSGDSQETDNTSGYLNVPRVIYQGDNDGDGVSDWTYFDGKGNRHYSEKLFWDGKNSFNTKKVGEHKIPCFMYYDPKIDKLLTVPKGTLVIAPNDY